MKLSNEQADYLIQLPKKIVEKDVLLDKLTINQEFPLNLRYELVSEKDDEFTFLFQIEQSKKNSIRISFHHQENDSNVGLLRVDFNGGHKNPENINSFLPDRFHPYAGKYFANHEHHIHYHIQGYRSLAWAIPLTDDAFAIKEINDDSSFNNTFAEIIRLFAKTINLETTIQINTLLL